MAQHFLLSKAAKTLSLIEVFKMTDEEIERIFAQLRWPETHGEATCVHCGSLSVWDCRRSSLVYPRLSKFKLRHYLPLPIGEL